MDSTQKRADGCPGRAALESFVVAGESDALIRAHADDCAACRELLVTIRDENALLRAYAPLDAPFQPRSAGSDLQIRGYDIVREIHRGGQGVVYHAIQRSTRRDVAIKVMRAGPFAGLADRARFDREVQLLAQLNHPNIVAIHDSGVADGSHYFVMDLVRGLPLDDYLAGPGNNLGLRGRMRLFADVCEAVNVAHLSGVIHRDLKPGNILVVDEAAGQRVGGSGFAGSADPKPMNPGPRSPSPQPKILDFGLAKQATASAQASTMTLTGHFVGTPQWAAPEQIDGGTRVDLRTDVYSLGVMLFHAMTGEFPYDVDGPWHEVARRIQLDEPARLRRGGHAIDDDVNTIVRKCLAKEPVRRYETAGALARDIRHYLAGEPLDARRDSTWYVVRKRLRRHRVPLLVAGGAVVALVAFAIVMSVLYRRAADAEQVSKRYAGQLSAQLSISNLERGRMLGLSGSVPLAEDLLWHEFLTSNAAPGIEFTDATFWALLELYARHPCVSTFPLAEPNRTSGQCIARFESEPPTLVLAARGGLVEQRDVRSAAQATLLSPQFDESIRLAGNQSTPRLLLSSDSSDRLFLIDVEQRCLRALSDVEPLARPGSAELSEDGRRLELIDREGSIRVYALDADGRAHELGCVPAMLDANSAVTISADGTVLASRSADGHICVWDVSDQRVTPRWERALSAVGGLLRISPDGQTLAFTQIPQSRVAFASMSDGEPFAWTQRFLPGVSRLLFDRRATRAVTSVLNGTDLHVYAISTGAAVASRIASLVGHRAIVSAPALSADGWQVASVAADGEAKIWDLPDNGRSQQMIRHSGTVLSVAFNSGGNALYCAGADGRVWSTRLADGTIEFDFRAHHGAGYQGTAACIAPSPTNRCSVTAGYDGALRLWETDTHCLLATLNSRTGGKFIQAAFHPSGRSIAAACEDKQVYVWNIQTFEHRTLPDHDMMVASVGYSPDGRWLASGDRKGELIVRDSDTGAIRFRLIAHANTVRTLAFSPDSRVVATGGDDLLVKFWDTATGAPVGQLQGHQQPVMALAFRPDGRLIASGDGDGTLIVWDTATRRNLLQLEQHDSVIFSVAFSPAGDLIATGASDDTARVSNLGYLQKRVAGNLDAALLRAGEQTVSPQRVAEVRAWARSALQR